LVLSIECSGIHSKTNMGSLELVDQMKADVDGGDSVVQNMEGSKSCMLERQLRLIALANGWSNRSHILLPEPGLSELLAMNLCCKSRRMGMAVLKKH
jgi:hypothetical protein